MDLITGLYEGLLLDPIVEVGCASLLDDVIATTLPLKFTDIGLMSPYTVFEGVVCDAFQCEVRTHMNSLKHDETIIFLS